MVRVKRAHALSRVALRRTRCRFALARRREYGLHAIDLQRLNADVAGVRVRKLKSRLVVALVKAGRGRGGAYGRTSAWTKLQAEPEKPSD